ncbi:MAG: hypothetical protein FWH15_07050 [Betaproteobacteria bacterium]|nr:hypothetical protein [Betaproteobacteria bacterium]
MENQQETRATNYDLRRRSAEYRFAFDVTSRTQKHILLASVSTLFVGILLFVSFVDHVINRELIVLLVVNLFIITMFCLLFFVFRPAITINQKGITCINRWGYLRLMPRHCAWNELSQIRLQIHEPKLFGQTMPNLIERKLVFIHRSGKQYLLTVSQGRFPQVFAGIGHSLSLEEAIEEFAGPIVVLGGKEKIPALTMDDDLGKEVKHVTYITLGAVILLVLLGFAPEPLYLLDNQLEAVFNWTFGLGSIFMALLYMRRVEHNAKFFIAILLGCIVWFLVVPFASSLPLFFGEEEQVIFAVSEENDERQRWTAVSDSELTFSLYVHPDERAYKGVGTEHSMTIHRGPGSLNAMPSQEYRALFRGGITTKRSKLRRDRQDNGT